MFVGKEEYEVLKCMKKLEIVDFMVMSSLRTRDGEMSYRIQFWFD